MLLGFGTTILALACAWGAAIAVSLNFESRMVLLPELPFQFVAAVAAFSCVKMLCVLLLEPLVIPKRGKTK